MASTVSTYLSKIIGLLVVAVSLYSSPAWAITPEEKAGARAAAQAGAEAFQQGRYEEAIDYFHRAERIIHAPPHLLYIARAELKLGHLVNAREAYIKITREELAEDAPRVFSQAQASAEEELAELEPRMPHVNVKVVGAPESDVSLIRDGVVLPSGLVGIPIPSDPGTHTFEAKAPGMASEARVISLTEGETAKLVLQLSATAAPAEPESPSGEAYEAAPEASPRSPLVRVLGYSSVGLGAAGVITGGVLMVMGLDPYTEANQLFDACNPGCSETEQEDINSLDGRAGDLFVAGAIPLAVGGALLVTGVTLLVIDGKARRETASTKATVRPLIGLGTIGISGTF